MAITLVKKNEFSDVANVTFTDLGSDYKLYLFKFWGISPATNNVRFDCQFNATGQTGFNEALTTTYIRCFNNEANSDNEFEFENTLQQPGASTQNYGILADAVSSESVGSLVGEMYLFDPSESTAFATDYVAEFCYHKNNSYVQRTFVTGFIRTTAGIAAADFKMSSGNMDGTIALYGIGAET
tara:strand:+ start:2591 stop:3139 length:549 start_codon:yes stop_codon:yes gene_type:complete